MSGTCCCSKLQAHLAVTCRVTQSLQTRPFHRRLLSACAGQALLTAPEESGEQNEFLPMWSPHSSGGGGADKNMHGVFETAQTHHASQRVKNAPATVIQGMCWRALWVVCSESDLGRGCGRPREQTALSRGNSLSKGPGVGMSWEHSKASAAGA